MPERKISLAAFYNSLFKARGFELAPHHYPLVAGLEDPNIDVLFMGPPGAGKSILVDIAYPLYELGHDPTLTVLSISAGEALPQGFMASCMQIITHDKTYKELFPNVRPDPDQGWSIQRGLYVKGHHQADPDASYKAIGISSKALTGLHARIHVYDDLHDRENASTPESRQVIKNTYYDTLLGRADPRGCRRVATGRWWAADDVYQEWINNGDFVVLQLPAVRDGNIRLWYDVSVPKGISCVYTETLKPSPDEEQDDASPYVKYRAYYGAFDSTKRGFYWPASPSKRREYETVARRQPRTAAINYRGDMTGGGTAIFREEDFIPYIPPVPFTAQGISEPGVLPWVKSHKGIIEEAWDTALGQPQSTSMTAALTAMFVPCQEWHAGEDPDLVGPCEFHYDVLLLDLMVKDIGFRDLAKELRTRHGKWHPRRINIEEKQSGVSLLQTFKGTHIPVRPIKVEKGKLERAINPVVAAQTNSSGKPIPGGAASVEGWVGMHRVRVPLGAEWLHKGPDGTAASSFLSRVCSFSGGLNASDEFDALVHLVTRAIILSRQTGRIGNVGAPVDEMAILIANDDDPRRLILNAFGEAEPYAHRSSMNPAQGLCMAPCTHFVIAHNQDWCAHHHRPTTAISGCGDWTMEPVRPLEQEIA